MKKTLVPFMVASTLALGIVTPTEVFNPVSVEASSNSSVMYVKSGTPMFVSKHQKSKKLYSNLKEGQKVWVYKHEGSWTHVRVNGRVGYIPKARLASNISISTPSNPNSSLKVTHTVKSKSTLRAGRHYKEKALAYMPAGADVSLVKYHGSWAEVVYNGKKGFVAKWSLKEKATSTATQSSYYVKSDVNLKAGRHQTAHKTLKVIKQGETITLVKYHGSWAEVVSGGVKGYVAKSVLTKTKPATTVTPKPVEDNVSYVDGILVNESTEKKLSGIKSSLGKFVVEGSGNTRQVAFYFTGEKYPSIIVSTGDDKKAKPIGHSVSLTEVYFQSMSTSVRTQRFNELVRLNQVVLTNVYQSKSDASKVTSGVATMLKKQKAAIEKDRKQLREFSDSDSVQTSKGKKDVIGIGSSAMLIF